MSVPPRTSRRPPPLLQDGASRHRRASVKATPYLNPHSNRYYSQSFVTACVEGRKREPFGWRAPPQATTVRRLIVFDGDADRGTGYRCVLCSLVNMSTTCPSHGSADGALRGCNEVRNTVNWAGTWIWFKYAPCPERLLEFDKDGRRLKSRRLRKGSIQNDDVVTDLASAHSDVVDSTLDITMGAVKEDKSDLFIKLVDEIHDHCKSRQGEKP